MPLNPLFIGAAFCGTGVVLGAWGAHGLSSYLAAQDLPPATSAWETAVLYQLVHGLAILVLGVWGQNSTMRLLNIAAVLLSAGIVLFCGSLYALTLDAPRWIGPVTPVGGSLLIAGWIAVLMAALKSRS